MAGVAPEGVVTLNLAPVIAVKLPVVALTVTALTDVPVTVALEILVTKLAVLPVTVVPER